MHEWLVAALTGHSESLNVIFVEVLAGHTPVTSLLEWLFDYLILDNPLKFDIFEKFLTSTGKTAFSFHEL